MEMNQSDFFMIPSEFSSAAMFDDHNGSGSGSSFFSPLPSLQPGLPQPPSIYSDFYARRASAALQFSHDHGLMSGGGACSDPLGFASLRAELIGKMSAQEIMDAKAQAASKSHSEAERRRRERINAHLAKLRSLLPSTTKTDKASLLAEVIQHVKDLKRQTSKLSEDTPLPTESDELTVDPASSDDDGRFIVKASLCCEDRSNLLQDLIKALKSMRLRTLKAEITTLGGRVKNILVITGDDDYNQQISVSSIQEVLKAVMQRSAAEAEGSHFVGGCIKRQRTNSLSSLLQQRSL